MARWADYYYESYPDGSSCGRPVGGLGRGRQQGGGRADVDHRSDDELGAETWARVLSILPSYAISKYGPQTGFDAPYLTNAGNGISVTNDTLITWNDPNDSYTPVDTNFQKGYVQHLITNWGVSTNGGVGYYIMDNEHTLWFSTHQDIHPVGTTMQEIFSEN